MKIMFQRANVGLVDEDLFEFMVRIANTPVEWERIRRVLSKYPFMVPVYLISVLYSLQKEMLWYLA